MAQVRQIELTDWLRKSRYARVYDPSTIRDFAVAGYDTPSLSYRLEPARPTPPLSADAAGFNVPAVETIKWPTVLPYLLPDERFVVDSVLSPDLFEARVLGQTPRDSVDRSADHVPHGYRKSKMPAAWIRELARLRYVKAPLSSLDPLVVCCLFAVIRPDGKMRLIWDGRPLNNGAIPPPRCVLAPIGDDLGGLMAPGNHAVLTWDFQSYFVQLTPHPTVADRYFRADLDGRQVVVAGLPMGFSWAPVIAQSVAEAFLREVLRRMQTAGLSPRHSSAYIDNFAVAFEDPSALPVARSIVEALAAEWGLVIKASSWQAGPRVEWRGVMIDLTARSFTFKESFAEKCSAALTSAISAEWNLTVDTSLPLVAYLIYITHTRGQIMASLLHVLRFLSRLASALGKNEIKESHVMRWPRAAADQAREVLGDLARPWTLPVRSAGTGRVFGVSDAAGEASDGAWRGWAYAFHSPNFMRVRAGPISSNDIFKEELSACVRGQVDALNGGQVHRVSWQCDNLRAIYVLERGWSAEFEANTMITDYHELVRYRSSQSDVSYVPSACNAVDFLTRGGRPIDRIAPACHLHPGEACPEFFAFLRGNSSGPALSHPRLSWAPSQDRITFHDGQPSMALGRLK